MTPVFSRRYALLLCVLIPIEIASAQPAVRVTNVKALQHLQEACSRHFRAEQARATTWCTRTGEPIRQEHDDGRITAYISVSGASPYAKTTLNARAADTVSADELWPGGSSGLNLNGNGVVLHEWDGGGVRTTHLELLGVSTWADDTWPGYSNHATHVAGTMVGLGIDPTARGMAFGASLQSYDWNDDDAEMAAAAAAGALVSNHSYGWIRGWFWNSFNGDWYWYGDTTVSQTEDAQFGFYDYTARTWDQIAFNAPNYLICKSAGNDRGDGHNGPHWAWSAGVGWLWSGRSRDDDGGAAGYDTIGQQGCAKNILTVGAVGDVIGGYAGTASVGMTSFSGWGPTDDGRIKPDIVANGVGLRSSVATSDASYSSFSGTSMAGPNTAGSLGLLIQHYRAGHGGADMRAATLKGLVIHTADESGASDGPDYRFGWGLLNVRAAAELVSRDESEPEAIQELNLAQGQTIRQTFSADGSEPLRVTICWTDPAGTPVALSVDPPNPMLVNDLDLTITAPDGTVYRPWILDPANPAAAAARGDNTRDNVEMVVVDPAPQGLYTIEITHKGALANGSQDVAVILSRGSGAFGCPAGEIPDCNGNCAPAAWLGDGTCDDGTRLHNGNLIDFSCGAFGPDGGDCPVVVAPYILWRQQSTGRNSLWYMNGTSVLPQSGGLPTVSDMDWFVAGTGDFDGDGNEDILWRHQRQGYNLVWFLNGVDLVPRSSNFATVVADWDVVATNDFDGDGKCDILWRNQFTGRNSLWFMDGTTVRPQSGGLPTESDLNWLVVGTGDFDGDGQLDILWRHLTNGRNRIWFMNGTTLVPAPSSFATVVADWDIVAANDFDGDGKCDILWRHQPTGRNSLWFMDGTTVRPQSGGLPTMSDPNWLVVGTADFDGDGQPDILWRHITDGRDRIWFMAGTTLVPDQQAMHTVSAEWSVVGIGE